jgi:hypothetical protein
MPRLPKAAFAIVPLAILALVIRSCTAEPPPNIQALVDTPERMVIDLITAPGPVRVRRGDTILALPGTPTRWLVAESTPTGATVGWATSAEGLCTEALRLTGPSGRVVVYPLPTPQVAGVEMWPGLAPGPQREAVIIESAAASP